MKVNILLISVLVMFSGASFAKGYLTSLESPTAEITQIFNHQGGGATLFVKGLTSNPDKCNYNDKVYLKGDLEGHQQMISSALVAFSSNKKVGFYSSGCSIMPFWGGSLTAPVINNLWVK